MKKISLIACAIALGGISMAQTVICPTSFKRDNGNGQCPAGRLTFQFSACPNPQLTIDSIYRGGVRQNVTIAGYSCNNGKAEYCITGGNLAPAGSLLVYFSQGGIPGTGYGCYVPESGPLPVILSSFNAKRAGNTVNVTWKTEAEFGAKEFVLQRKTESAYVDVAVIAAANSANGSSYSFNDQNSIKTISQYRLKMIDLDGTAKYSDIKAIKGLNGASEFVVFPNPSTGSAKVTISDVSEGTDVQLIDQAGRIVKTITNVTSNINLNNLQKGMYLIRVINKQSGESTTQKLSVIN